MFYNMYIILLYILFSNEKDILLSMYNNMDGLCAYYAKRDKLHRNNIVWYHLSNLQKTVKWWLPGGRGG